MRILLGLLGMFDSIVMTWSAELILLRCEGRDTEVVSRLSS
jgi:hypothetical protein